MRQEILREMEKLIEEAFYVKELKQMLLECIHDKWQEHSRWGEITLYTHRLFRGEQDHPAVASYAAVTELLVLALDIADDLQDQDNLEKTWMRYPQDLALNAVMALMNTALGATARLQADISPAPRATVISEMVNRAINGQHTDLLNAIHTEEDYLTSVSDKSAALLRIACYMGYSLCELTDEQKNQMDELATLIGIINQIQNDIGDLVRFDLKNDLLRKKKTLPILYLLSPDTVSFAPLDQFYAGTMDQEQFLTYKQACVQFIHNSGCLEYAKVVQTLYLNRIQEIFAQMPCESAWKDSFQEVTYGSIAEQLSPNQTA